MSQNQHDFRNPHLQEYFQHTYLMAHQYLPPIISYSKVSILFFLHLAPLRRNFFPTSYPVTENELIALLIYRALPTVSAVHVSVAEIRPPHFRLAWKHPIKGLRCLNMSLRSYRSLDVCSFNHHNQQDNCLCGHLRMKSFRMCVCVCVAQGSRQSQPYISSNAILW